MHLEVTAVGFELRPREGALLGANGDLASGAGGLSEACRIAPDTARLHQGRNALAAVLKRLGRFPELRDLRATQWRDPPPRQERAPLARAVGEGTPPPRDPRTAPGGVEHPPPEDPPRRAGP